MPARRNPRDRLVREYARILSTQGRVPSADELQARLTGGLTRRDLLRMGGLLGAGLALAACGPGGGMVVPSPEAGASTSGTSGGAKPRVAVVGGGLAGMTAAYRLSAAGFPVRLFEAQDRLGGRCWTLHGFKDGQIAEHGGEFVDTRHVHLRGLAEELGLPLEDLWDGWVPGSIWPVKVDGHITTSRDLRSGEKEIVAAVTNAAEEAGITTRGTFDNASISYGTATPGAVEMDQASAEDWLDQRVPGVWKTTSGRLLNESLQGWYGLSAGGLGALNLVDYYIVPWKGGDERYHVKGGSDMLIQGMAAALPEGMITMEAPLERLSKNSDGTYELAFTGQSGPVTADRVVLALPFTTLRRVDLDGAGFPAERMDAIATHAMGTNTKLQFQIDRAPADFEVLDRPWSGGMEQVDAGWETWEAVQGQPGRGGVITVWAGGNASTQFMAPEAHGTALADMTASTVKAVQEVVPGIAEAVVGDAYLDYWPADMWVAGSYAAFGPGQTTKLWGYSYRPEGNVHFAGEHTSTYSQGFLNGGVESGQRAAIEIMNAAGVPVPDTIANLPYTPELS